MPSPWIESERMAVRPTVRSLIVCEAIEPDADHPTRVSLVHLIDSIRSTTEPAYPVVQPQLSVFAQLTECRGTVEFQVRVHDSESDQPAFGSGVRRQLFSNTPLLLHGVRFRLLDCPFRHPGLYWVQLWIEGELAAQTPLLLR